METDRKKFKKMLDDAGIKYEETENTYGEYAISLYVASLGDDYCECYMCRDVYTEFHFYSDGSLAFMDYDTF